MDQAVTSLRNRRKSDRESVLRYLYRAAANEYLWEKNWSIKLFARQLGVREWDFHFWLNNSQSDLADGRIIPGLEAFLAREESIALGRSVKG
jgi:hypothetical protein